MCSTMQQKTAANRVDSCFCPWWVTDKEEVLTDSELFKVAQTGGVIKKSGCTFICVVLAVSHDASGTFF